jgi:hypothetical protein
VKIVNAIAMVGVLACGQVQAQLVLDDISGLDQLRIVNESISDVQSVQAVPDPVTWNTAVTDDFDWSPFTVCCSTWEYGNPGVTLLRSAGSGFTLISPSWAAGNDHVPSTGEQLTWMEPDGDEVTRSVVQSIPIVDSDFRLVRLSAPITTIEPASLLTDAADVDGELIACLEHDRHINVMTVDSLTGNRFIQVGSPLTPGDGLEGGDSGKIGVEFIDGHMVLVCGWSTATTGWNIAHPELLATIRGYVEASGEELTFVDDVSPPPEPIVPSGDYFLRAGTGTPMSLGGRPITIGVE